MSKHTTSAAAAGLPNHQSPINRRKALATMSGAAVAAVLPVEARTHEGGIHRAIEAHKEALRKYSDACGQLEKAEDAYDAVKDKLEHRLIPARVFGHQNIQDVLAKWEAQEISTWERQSGKVMPKIDLGDDGILFAGSYFRLGKAEPLPGRATVKGNYDEIRQQITGDNYWCLWATDYLKAAKCDNAATDLKTAIEKSIEAAHAIVDAEEKRLEIVEEKAALSSAQRTYDETYDAGETALLAFLGCATFSPAEHRAKRDYLAHLLDRGIIDGNQREKNFFSVLLQSAENTPV